MFNNYNKLKRKNSIKVYQNIKVVYCDQKNLVMFIGPSQIKSLKLKVKIFILPLSNLIVITNVPAFSASTTDFKTIKKIQGTTIAKIKQVLIETLYILYYKLNLIGVGYKAFLYNPLNNQLYFKLGFSHLVYFKVSDSLKIHCQKFTKLFLFGRCSFNNLTQIASQIRAFKLPDPYKGKGILYDQEKVILKKAKKT